MVLPPSTDETPLVAEKKNKINLSEPQTDGNRLMLAASESDNVPSIRDAADNALTRLADEFLQTVAATRRRPRSCAGYILRAGLRALERAFEWHVARCGHISQASTVRQHLYVVGATLRDVGMTVGAVHLARVIALSKTVVQYVEANATCAASLAPPLSLHEDNALGFVMRGVPRSAQLRWLDAHFAAGGIVGEILLLPYVRSYERLHVAPLWRLAGKTFALDSQKPGVRKAALRPAVATSHVVT